MAATKGRCSRRTASGLSKGCRASGASALLFEPGTGYRYSSYGWILVSAAIEAAAHEDFFEFMQDEVFGPLGMAHTRADSVTDPTARVTAVLPEIRGRAPLRA